MSENLERLNKNWILITTGYFALGLLSISLYYAGYGINILTFIDVTELLTIWLPISTAQYVLVGICIVVFVFLEKAGKVDKVQYHYYHFVARTCFLAAEITFILRYFCYYGDLSEDALMFIRTTVGFLLCVIVCVALFIHGFQTVWASIKAIYRQARYGADEQQESIQTSISIWALTIFVFIMPTVEIQARTFTDPVPAVTTMVTKSDTVVSTNDLRYIGKTRNYAIFYDKINGKAKVYSLGDLVQFNQDYVKFKRMAKKNAKSK
ncbi:hypothetical protein D0C36_22955 [Mucilaginibacter conchicola]|uniref:Uncharacterized protein n=1 Tax=Mucilaginibacter conchicola TaxID=2303333 RepID=A0A372NME1_9SPHI|nr:hypothetical protein [Mucilaginibacter conchicola]RFZ90104.1 hypothetical protein D0C36_22955 [Mucilaginibacter conchicola]